MATNSNIMVPQNYTTKYSNLVHGWSTSHPTTHIQKVYHIDIPFDIPLPPHCDSSNVASVYLNDYDYEETKKSYNTKIINATGYNQLLPDDTYICWDEAIEIMVNKRVDVIMEDEAEDIIDDMQSLADDTASPMLTLVEPDHGLLQSTTMSPPPSDDKDIDAFGEIKVRLMF